MVIEIHEIDVCECCRRFCGCTPLPLPRQTAPTRVSATAAATQVVTPEADVKFHSEKILSLF